jgi:AraC-like DNA-binding protein
LIVDVLADVLSRARARGGAFGRTVLSQPWGVEFDASLPLAIHAALGGESWAATGEHSARLLAGDVALIRGGGTSWLASRERPRLVGLADAVLRFGNDRRELVFPGEATADLLCGAYSFAGDLGAGVLDTLPPILHLRAGAHTAALRPLLALLADELTRPQPGQQVVLDRTLDLLLVHILRAHYAQPGANPPRWYLALDDPSVGASLRAIHAEPARDWDVAALAHIAGLSRAAFARRFSEFIGEPPLAYLTGWRMKLARERLREPTATLAQVAGEVGYSNQYAFAAAFKRTVGEPPGRWRARTSETMRGTHEMPGERSVPLKRGRAPRGTRKASRR